MNCNTEPLALEAPLGREIPQPLAWPRAETRPGSGLPVALASCGARRVASAEQSVYEAVLFYRDFTVELGPRLLVASSLAPSQSVMRNHDRAAPVGLAQLTRMGIGKTLVDAFCTAADRTAEHQRGVPRG